MSTQNKSENNAAMLAAGIERKSWSRTEFCARHGISLGLLKKLRDEGRGPHEVQLFDRIIITDDAEVEWLAANAKLETT
ncbi:hypothetical protein HAP47_0001500 [Bradyrhizobium sp. 41S5]|uniref:hypothetical protein n=1 Tax=Bradyrhizobium sp. 41S5 TaxID=1404443 RepID=UPI00156AE94A|nr:hypothetical protein [Bradyrhizobium sp. 41S5]UFX45435.1 hypothetical protein HAP47_0001500 [Bradyrhizobium sp. 41S5]